MDGRRGISAVIAAAGASERMGFDKINCLIRGIPSIVRVLSAFESSRETLETIVVTRAESVDTILGYKEKYGLKKLKTVVAGGKSRQESAAIGFLHVSPEIDFIAVHDGARPLVSPEDIDAVSLSAYENGAAIAATAEKNTVKLISDDGFIEKTLDRRHIVSAATPQIFSREIYANIVSSFSGDFASFTDDSSMAEALGVCVKSVICAPTNIKLTSPEDIIIIERLLDLT